MSAAEIDSLVKEGQFETELVNLIRSNPTGINFDPNLAAVSWRKGSYAPDALKEAVEVNYNQILATTAYEEKMKEIENVTKDIKESKEWIDQAQKTMTEQNLWSNKEILAEYNKKYTDMLNSQKQMFPLNMEASKITFDAAQQARDAVWTENNKLAEAQAKAKNELTKMIDTKLAELPSYNTKKVDQVKNIVSKITANTNNINTIPTIDSVAAEAKAVLWDDDGSMLKAYNIANDTTAKGRSYYIQGG